MAAEKERVRGWSDAAAQPIAIFGAVFALAAIFYSFHLGRDPLGASEAYSAYAAARPSVGAIVRIPIADDPGKQLLYYIVLHFWTMIFGAREAGLRAMSAVFGLCALAMIFALGRDLFDDAAGAGAAAMWAFNPMATVFSYRARMYTMLIAFALAHVYALRRTRDRSSVGWTLVCAVSGAAVIYTHLGGAAIIAAEAAILVRDFMRRQAKRRPVDCSGRRRAAFRSVSSNRARAEPRADSRTLARLDRAGLSLFDRDQALGGGRRRRTHVVDGVRKRARNR